MSEQEPGRDPSAVTPHVDQHDREDPDVLVERALTHLHLRGVRRTAPRRQILQFLARQHDHLTPEEVAQSLGTGSVHRATVYRSMEVLAEAGLLTHRQLAGGATAYHLNSAGHLHGHCAVCHRVVALPADAFESAHASIHAKTGFSFDPNRSSLLGLCGKCRSEGRRRA